jgi:hypothetical protein
MQPSPNPAAFAVTTLASGEIATWDGTSVDLFDASGAFLLNLTTFSTPVFTTFIRPTPDGTAVVIGNSSNGRIHRVAADGTGRVQLSAVANNFDACFDASGNLYLSAAPCGFGCGNRILRLSPAGGVPDRVASVSGPSGPIAIDANGNLLCAIIDEVTFGADRILVWTAAQLASGALLGEADATVLATDFPAGAFSMAVDPVTQRAYLSSFDQFLRVEQDAGNSRVVAQSDGFISNLQFLSGSGAGSFDPYQPGSGPNLRYLSGPSLHRVSPARPSLSVRGPGTSGQGAFTFDVSGAEPNAGLTLMFAPSATFNPLEQTYFLPTFILHTGLDLLEVERLSLQVATDAAGAASVTFYNPGGLEGQFAYQFLVRDASGTAIGSTSSVLF